MGGTPEHPNPPRIGLTFRFWDFHSIPPLMLLSSAGSYSQPMGMIVLPWECAIQFIIIITDVCRRSYCKICDVSLPVRFSDHQRLTFHRVRFAGMGIVRDFANFPDFEIDLPRKQKLVRRKKDSVEPKKKKAPVLLPQRTIGARSCVVTVPLSR